MTGSCILVFGLRASARAVEPPSSGGVSKGAPLAIIDSFLTKEGNLSKAASLTAKTQVYPSARSQLVQPFRARLTAASISSTVIRLSWLRSPAKQAEGVALPRAMFTIERISSTVTWLFALQSPSQVGVPLTVGDGVGVSPGGGVGVGVSATRQAGSAWS